MVPFAFEQRIERACDSWKEMVEKGEEIIESFAGYAKECGLFCLLGSVVPWSV